MPCPYDFWCSTYSPLALGPALARVLAVLATNVATGFWSTTATACAGALVAHSTATFCSADSTAPSWAALRTERPILATQLAACSGARTAPERGAGGKGPWVLGYETHYHNIQ